MNLERNQKFDLEDFQADTGYRIVWHHSINLQLFVGNVIFPWIGESIRIIPISLTNSVLRKHLRVDINEGVSIAKGEMGGSAVQEDFSFNSSEQTGGCPSI